jgi:hypothetical protein
MTTTIDAKCRAYLKHGTGFKPGDVLQIESQGPDVVVLKRMKQAQIEDVPVLKLSRGKIVWPKGVKKPTPEDVARAVREERDSR